MFEKDMDDADEESSILDDESEKKAQKIEKFSESSKPKVFSTFLKMLLLSTIFVLISLTDYYLSREQNNTIEKLQENQKSLSLLQMNVNYAFAALYESTALLKPGFKIEGEEVLKKYLDGILVSKKDLINEISENFPNGFENYRDNLKNFMSTDLCKNYFSKIKKGNFKLKNIIF